MATIALSPLTSRAVITITFEEVGADVVMTGSGSWGSRDGLTSAGSTTPINSIIRPSDGLFRFGKSAGGTLTVYSGATIVDNSFGTGALYNPDPSVEATGDVITWIGGNLGLPGESGTFSSSVTFSGQSLSSLGITTGSRTLISWDSGAESLVVTATAAVPEPASFGAVIGLFVLAFSAFGRRRNVRSQSI